MEEKNRFEIEDTYGGNHENEGTYGDFVLKKPCFFVKNRYFSKYHP